MPNVRTKALSIAQTENERTDSALHEIFRSVAASHPERIAITAPDGEFTYRELDARSDQLALRLRDAGVAGGSIVALYVERGRDMAVGILGILKAGGAYLPIDPTLPERRVRWLLDDSRTEVAVTTPELLDELGQLGPRLLTIQQDHETTRVNPSPAIESMVTDLAYVIYTSGSTGVPKGVQIEHRNVIRLFEQTDEWVHFCADDVWSLFHSIGFDFSVWEFWGALLHGGRLAVVPFDVSRSPVRFRDFVQEQGVTVLNQTPLAFRQFIQADELTEGVRNIALRLVILGGERVDVKTLNGWFERYRDSGPELINMYGITETTVHASVHRITQLDFAHPDASVIGVPLGDLSFVVKDVSGQVVPKGEAGELWICGDGVARGYLNRPDLTRRSFVPGAVSPEQRFYRTGDRVACQENGEYRYLGRVDDQLKVRGFRVEPAEVELILNSHPEIAASVVTTHDYGDGDVRLIAHVVPVGTEANQEWVHTVREELRDEIDALPFYMRPSTYLIMSSIPMTENGKIDRSALPIPSPSVDKDDLSDDKSQLGPLGRTENIIAEIWCEMLDLPSVGSEEDFFDIGGTSLTLIRMFNEVNGRFKTSLDIAALVHGATVAKLAKLVNSASQ